MRYLFLLFLPGKEEFMAPVEVRRGGESMGVVEAGEREVFTVENENVVVSLAVKGLEKGGNFVPFGDVYPGDEGQTFKVKPRKSIPVEGEFELRGIE